MFVPRSAPLGGDRSLGARTTARRHRRERRPGPRGCRRARPRRAPGGRTRARARASRNPLKPRLCWREGAPRAASRARVHGSGADRRCPRRVLSPSAPAGEPQTAIRDAVTIRVSLVVPLQDEETTVCTLLASIAEQTRPPDEIILVDAGSRDETCQRIRAYRKQEGLRLVREGRIHPGSARNAGVVVASHPWLAFTDAGIRLDPFWLESLVGALGDPPGDVVFGSIEPVCANTLQECAAIAYIPSRTAEGIRGPSVASMLLRRSRFEDAGSFPPYRAAEDLVFLERLLAAKPGVRYAPRALAHWSIPGTVLATYRRFALYSFHNLAAGRGRYLASRGRAALRWSCAAGRGRHLGGPHELGTCLSRGLFSCSRRQGGLDPPRGDPFSPSSHSCPWCGGTTRRHRLRHAGRGPALARQWSASCGLMANAHILYLSYNGLAEPLGRRQVLPYIAGLAARGHRFTVISFEKPGLEPDSTARPRRPRGPPGHLDAAALPQPPDCARHSL